MTDRVENVSHTSLEGSLSMMKIGPIPKTTHNSKLSSLQELVQLGKTYLEKECELSGLKEDRLTVTDQKGVERRVHVPWSCIFTGIYQPIARLESLNWSLNSDAELDSFLERESERGFPTDNDEIVEWGAGDAGCRCVTTAVLPNAAFTIVRCDDYSGIDERKITLITPDIIQRLLRISVNNDECGGEDTRLCPAMYAGIIDNRTGSLIWDNNTALGDLRPHYEIVSERLDKGIRLTDEEEDVEYNEMRRIYEEDKHLYESVNIID